MINNGFADDRGFRETPHVLIGEHCTAGNAAIKNFGVIRRFAHHLCIPIQAVGQNLFAITNFRADGGNIRQFGNRFGIFKGQRRSAAPAAAHRAAGEIAGKNRDHIFSQAGDLVLDLFGGAGSQAYGTDDGADADDDAEHRQQRTHLVPAQGAPGDFERGEEFS